MENIFRMISGGVLLKGAAVHGAEGDEWLKHLFSGPEQSNYTLLLQQHMLSNTDFNLNFRCIKITEMSHKSIRQ